jgi:acyl carrier protein
MLTRETVEGELAQALAELRPAQASQDSGNGNPSQLALDSLDMVELTLMVEERWGVEIRAADADELRSVRQLAELIVRLRQ